MLGTQCKLINVDGRGNLKGDGNAAQGKCYTDFDKYVGRCNKNKDDSEIVSSSLVTVQSYTSGQAANYNDCLNKCIYFTDKLNDPCTAFEFSSTMCRTFTMSNGLAKDRVVKGSSVASEGECHQIPIP